jgi:hypothetical protein
MSINALTTTLVTGRRSRVRGSALARPLARLRSSEPVNARGIAQLRQLLSDSNGPCYRRTQPQALTLALEEVSRWLDVDD